MTLINLFRRYERWNPVHPTYGAFWGIGFGLGCGVGWGPGFGPEVIGYVGSGCGVGMSVGVTMLGIGIGLPAGGLACLPSDVVSYAGHGIMDFTKSTAAPAASTAVKWGWSALCLHLGAALERSRHRHLSHRGHDQLQMQQQQPLAAFRQGWVSLIQKAQLSRLPRLPQADSRHTKDES